MESTGPMTRSRARTTGMSAPLASKSAGPSTRRKPRARQQGDAEDHADTPVRAIDYEDVHMGSGRTPDAADTAADAFLASSVTPDTPKPDVDAAAADQNVIIGLTPIPKAASTPYAAQGTRFDSVPAYLFSPGVGVNTCGVTFPVHLAASKPLVDNKASSDSPDLAKLFISTPQVQADTPVMGLVSSDGSSHNPSGQAAPSSTAQPMSHGIEFKPQVHTHGPTPTLNLLETMAEAIPPTILQTTAAVDGDEADEAPAKSPSLAGSLTPASNLSSGPTPAGTASSSVGAETPQSVLMPFAQRMSEGMAEAEAEDNPSPTFGLVSSSPAASPAASPALPAAPPASPAAGAPAFSPSPMAPSPGPTPGSTRKTRSTPASQHKATAATTPVASPMAAPPAAAAAGGIAPPSTPADFYVLGSPSQILEVCPPPRQLDLIEMKSPPPFDDDDLALMEEEEAAAAAARGALGATDEGEDESVKDMEEVEQMVEEGADEAEGSDADMEAEPMVDDNLLESLGSASSECDFYLASDEALETEAEGGAADTAATAAEVMGVGAGEGDAGALLTVEVGGDDGHVAAADEGLAAAARGPSPRSPAALEDSGDEGGEDVITGPDADMIEATAEGGAAQQLEGGDGMSAAASAGAMGSGHEQDGTEDDEGMVSEAESAGSVPEDQIDPAIDALTAELLSMGMPMDKTPLTPSPAPKPSRTPHSTPVSISRPTPGGMSPELGCAAKTAGHGSANRKAGSSPGAPTSGSDSVSSTPSPVGFNSKSGKGAPARASAAGEGLGSPGHTPFPSKMQVAAAAGKAHSNVINDNMKAAHLLGGQKKAARFAAASTAMEQSVKHTTAAAAPAKSSSPGSYAASASAAAAAAGSTKPSGRVVPSRLCQPTASSLAKAKPGHGPAAAGSSEPKPRMKSVVVVNKPLAAAAVSSEEVEDEHCSTAAAAGGKTRVKSKVVVPSPAAAEQSLKSLNRQLKERMAEKARRKVEAEAALQKSKKVTSMSAMRSTKAPKPVESETMDMSMACGAEDDGVEVTQPMRGDRDKENKVNQLADSLSGLTMCKGGGANIPLKGVPVPKGKHTRFDEEGNTMRSPGISNRTVLRGVPMAQGKRTVFED